MLASVGTAATQLRTKILVVEDDEVSQRALVQILRLHDFQVTSASTLRSALDQLDDATRVVLLDLMLPDGNGMDVLLEIRHRRLPVEVAVITGAGQTMVDHALKLAPARLFTKPLDIAALLEWLHAIGEDPTN